MCCFQALRAKYEGAHAEEAWHLLQAGQWNTSHTVVLTHLAADNIIHGSIHFTLYTTLYMVVYTLHYTQHYKWYYTQHYTCYYTQHYTWYYTQ